MNRNLNKYDIPIRSNGEHKIKGIIGFQFCKWKVLGRVESKHKQSRWLVECACGNKSEVYYANLKYGKTTQCKECSGKSFISQEVLTATYWSHIKTSAKNRNIVVDITKEYAYNVFLKQNGKCALTGMDITFAVTSQLHYAGNTTASLDRIDSKKGYLQDNVQWVHKHLNKMKQSFPQDYFISICTMVANFNCTKVII